MGEAGDLRRELTGTWLRSFEEEAGDELVFRPPGYAFPPVRAARPTLRLHDDGTAVALRPGPADRPEGEPGGHWSVRARTLSLHTPALSGTFAVETVGADRLVVRRAAAPKDAENA
jgi:hypothetical protein